MIHGEGALKADACERGRERERGGGGGGEGGRERGRERERERCFTKPTKFLIRVHVFNNIDSYTMDKILSTVHRSDKAYSF